MSRRVRTVARIRNGKLEKVDGALRREDEDEPLSFGNVTYADLVGAQSAITPAAVEPTTTVDVWAGGERMRASNVRLDFRAGELPEAEFTLRFNSPEEARDREYAEQRATALRNIAERLRVPESVLGGENMRGVTRLTEEQAERLPAPDRMDAQTLIPPPTVPASDLVGNAVDWRSFWGTIFSDAMARDENSRVGGFSETVSYAPASSSSVVMGETPACDYRWDTGGLRATCIRENGHSGPHEWYDGEQWYALAQMEEPNAGGVLVSNLVADDIRDYLSNRRARVYGEFRGADGEPIPPPADPPRRRKRRKRKKKVPIEPLQQKRKLELE